MYSAYKLNKKGDNVQPWQTPFATLNQSVVPCRVCYLLTCIQVSQDAGKVVWYSRLFKTFPQFVVIRVVDVVSTGDIFHTTVGTPRGWVPLEF